MRMRLTEAVGGCLWQDLQQIDICIKKQKLGVDITPLMAEMTSIFKETDSDKLYRDIRAFSLRLNDYMDRGAVQYSLEEIAKMDRNFSTAYEDLRARYERIYKSWRLKREDISNILAQLNLFNSESYTEELHNRIQQVNKGFKKMRKALEDQGNALKGYFDAIKRLVASTNSTLPGPTPPDDHNSEISLTGALPDPSHLPKAIEEGKGKLSEIGSMVGKARYNQTRRVVEEGLSTTTSKLDRLQGHSEKYESKVLALSLYQPQHVKWWNQWREPAYQLPNLVKKMTNKLTEIQRGFDKYKQLIFGLIFRPLGDITEDLKPYLSQVGREVVTKRLHPDMILYEAAFLFLIKSSSRLLGLVEVTEGYKSRLEGMLSGN
ncbi:hypothetical protein FRC20_001123 [Serendipita sp. 405]|nr:hypothetical protein FRC20_001123 [Serendipita sp. 405]